MDPPKPVAPPRRRRSKAQQLSNAGSGTSVAGDTAKSGSTTSEAVHRRENADDADNSSSSRPSHASRQAHQADGYERAPHLYEEIEEDVPATQEPATEKSDRHLHSDTNHSSRSVPDDSPMVEKKKQQKSDSKPKKAPRRRKKFKDSDAAADDVETSNNVTDALNSERSHAGTASSRSAPTEAQQDLDEQQDIDPEDEHGTETAHREAVEVTETDVDAAMRAEMAEKSRTHSQGRSKFRLFRRKNKKEAIEGETHQPVEFTCNVSLETEELRVDERVPISIRLAVEYLWNSRAMNEEGLFRVSGNKTEINKLVDQSNKGKLKSLKHVLDPHTVCGFLKQILKQDELPLDGGTARRLLEVASAKAASDADKIDQIKQLLVGLPSVRKYTLQALVQLLRKIIRWEGNLMHAGNLGTSAGPTLFPCVPIQMCTTILTTLVDNYDTCFDFARNATPANASTVHSTSSATADASAVLRRHKPSSSDQSQSKHRLSAPSSMTASDASSSVSSSGILGSLSPQEIRKRQAEQDLSGRPKSPVTVVLGGNGSSGAVMRF